MRRWSSPDKLRYLLFALHSTSMRLPLLRQRGHDIRPRAERCQSKTIRRIVFDWKRGESGEKHRTRLCRCDCVCPSRACRLFRHAQTEEGYLPSSVFLYYSHCLYFNSRKTMKLVGNTALPTKFYDNPAFTVMIHFVLCNLFPIVPSL